MDRLTSTRVQELIVELDRLVDRNGAKIRMQIYGGGADESMIEANLQGFLCGGIEFLKAAFDENTDPAGFDDLLTDDSDIGFDIVQRVEDFDEDHARESLIGKIVGLVGIAVLMLLCLSIVVGVITMVRWMF